MSAEKRKTILLVEDEAVIAMTEKAVLEKYGYRVITAHTGEEAVETVEKTPGIDLILMDINLGAGIDGTEAAAIILGRRDLPVVFLSSHTEADVVEKTEKITSYGYVVKNSSNTVLDASIKMAFKLFGAKISEKKKEKALRESEEKYHTLFNEMLNGFALHEIICNDEGVPVDYRFLAVNPAFERITGLKAAELIGRTVREVLPGIERHWIETYGKVALTGEPAFFENSSIGLQKHFEVTAFQPAANQFACIFADVTERKRAEEELRNRNRYIESILDNMPIGFAVNTIDDGVARYTNDNFVEIYGWPKEVLTDVDRFFENVYPGAEGRELKARVIRDMCSGDPEKMAWDNLKITTRTGEHRYISARNIPILEQNLMVSTVWDSTQIHEFQEALRKSEERYRSILNASPDSIAITDMEGHIAMVSPATLTMFGCKREEEMLGRLFIDFVDPADRDRASSGVARMSQSESAELGEYRGLRTDGSVVDVEVNGEFVRNAEGRSTQMVFIIRDISKRKRTEEAQSNAETRYRLLFEKSPDGIVIIDPATAKILEFNETAHRQLGYSREEFSRLSIPDIEAVETPQDTQSQIARVMREGVRTFGTRQRTRQGEIRNILVTAQFTKVGEHPVYHCIWRDITETKRAEEVLQNTLRFQQSLLDAIPSPVFYKNADLAYIGGNKAFEQYIGLSREQFIGRTVFAISPPDLAEKYERADRELLKSQGVQTYEASVVHADGTRRDVVFHKAPFTDAQGQVAGLIGVILDISERKRAEEEVKRQLAEKEILLKEVHHRIKNNIASIAGLISLRLQSVTNREAIAVLQETIGRVDSMRILYDKLLLGGDYRDVSVKNYVESLTVSVVNLFPGNGKVTLDQRIADFQLDPKRLFPLGIIINELLTNIMKYAFIDRDAGGIKITLAHEDNRVTLAIQDNGIGLPDGFDIHESKGFGLMLVKMLSQQLGGSFSIQTHAGTRCVIEFNM